MTMHVYTIIYIYTTMYTYNYVLNIIYTQPNLMREDDCTDMFVDNFFLRLSSCGMCRRWMMFVPCITSQQAVCLHWAT